VSPPDPGKLLCVYSHSANEGAHVAPFSCPLTAIREVGGMARNAPSNCLSHCARRSCRVSSNAGPCVSNNEGKRLPTASMSCVISSGVGMGKVLTGGGVAITTDRSTGAGITRRPCLSAAISARSAAFSASSESPPINCFHVGHHSSPLSFLAAITIISALGFHGRPALRSASYTRKLLS
jgi:hypothetical protein